MWRRILLFSHTFIKRLRGNTRAQRSEERTPSSLVTTKEIQEKKNFKEGKVSVSYKAREVEGGWRGNYW